MRMIFGYKPTDTLFPVVLVSTHSRRDDPPVTEAVFVPAVSVDEAIYKTLVEGPQWVLVKEHKSVEEALDYGRMVGEAFGFIENQDTKGKQLYEFLYNDCCPEDLKIV